MEINEEQKKTFFMKVKDNPWMMSTFALTLIVAVFLIFLLINYQSQSKVVGNAVKLFEDVSGTQAILVDSSKSRDVYEITMNVDDKEVVLETIEDFSFIRMKGTPYWTKVSDLQELADNPVDTSSDTSDTTSQEISKSDKPKVELFVMTQCPYGTQAEKAIIPAIKALGNKIDAKIRFVHYFMHGDVEEQETYNQLCIRQENSGKYLDYLSCYLEDGNATRCLAKFGLKDQSCKEKAKEYYAEDSGLSEGYSVQGSPTLVINGVETSFNRSPTGALSAICSAFNTQPEECNTELSSTSASPGFGYEAGSNTQAQC